MEFKYIRIQGREWAENTMHAKGIFSVLVTLLQKDALEKEDGDLFKEINSWFHENLPWPEACNKGERVICFFKTENSEEMLKMINPLMWLLEKYNHPYDVIYTNYPGEIVYEDKYQVCCKVEDIVIEPQISTSI